MKIAILAYGSLIWDEENLAPRITGGWRRGHGPVLPVEFCRVSPKRGRALVLALDEEAGAPVPTSHTTSRRHRVEEAVADLAARERCAPRYIGIAHHDGRHAQCSARIARVVNAWLALTDYDAAIWAGLPANFEEHAGTPFSHEAGLAWLRQLPPASLQEGWRYITNAPGETDTPFRRFLARQAWWRALTF